MRSGTLNVPGISASGGRRRSPWRRRILELERVAGLRDLPGGSPIQSVPDTGKRSEGPARSTQCEHHLSWRSCGRRHDGSQKCSGVCRFRLQQQSVTSVPCPSGHRAGSGGRPRTVRFGLSRFTTAEEIVVAAERIAAAVVEVRSQQGVRRRSAVNEEQPQG